MKEAGWDLRASERPNPFRDQLGIRIGIPRPGRCVADLPDLPVSRDPDAGAHPGAVATLVDVAMGHALGSQVCADVPFATVHLAIVFHAGGIRGPLTACGQSGDLAAHWQEAATRATVRADGRTVASAVGLFARRPPGDLPAAPEGDGPQTDAGSLHELLSLRPSGEDFLLHVHGPLLNPDGVAHGGALAAALDEAMRTGLRSLGAQGLRPLTIDVSYLSAGLPGVLVLRCAVLRHGRAIHFARAAAERADGRLVAVASATYRKGEA